MDCIRLIKYYYYKGLRILRRQGLIAFVSAILRKLKHVIFISNSADWYVRDISAPLPDIVPRLNAQVIFDSRNELIEWLREHHLSFSWMYSPLEIKTALSDGHIFPHLKHNGEIVGYVKLGFKRVYILDYGKIIEFPPKQCFIYDTFIMPDSRGKELAPFLVRETIKWLKGQGFERIWCHIPSWNISSCRAFEKLGFQKVGNVRYLKLLGIEFFTKDPRVLITSQNP